MLFKKIFITDCYLYLAVVPVISPITSSTIMRYAKSKTSKCRLSGVILLLVCFSLLNIHQPLLGQTSKEESEKKEKTTDESDFPKKLKSKETWEYIIDLPGKILYLPFWLLNEAAKPICSLVGVAPDVYSKLARILISADGRRGLMPSYNPRHGGGVKFFLKDLTNPGSKLDITAKLGLRWRQYYRIQLRRFQLGKGLKSDFSVYYHYFPDEPFFGIGNSTFRKDKTNFGHRQAAAFGTLGVDLDSKTRVTATFGFENNNISKGKAPDTESTTELPLEAKKHIPGLSDQVNLFNLQFQLQHDSRNRLGNPSGGWEIDIKGRLFHQLGDSKYAFWKSSADFARYLHLFYDRTLVLRIATEITRTYKNGQIPFYYLSELGRRETIRGFPRGRFRDNDMILGSLEYRFPLMKRGEKQMGLDAVYFIDAGQVSQDIFNNFSLKDFHVGFGGGVRLYSRNGFILQMVLGKSKDGFRFYLVLY